MLNRLIGYRGDEMSRNPVSKKILKLLRIACLAEKNSWSLGETLERRAQAKQESLVGRREFLFVAGKTALMLPFAGTLATHALADLVLQRPKFGEESVAILGGGAAGLTAAYRLARAGISSAIYEASHRLGGRMFTHQRFNSDGMFCELGGELVDTGHEDLISLCKEIGIEIQNLADPESSSDLFFAGSKKVTAEELLAAFAPLAASIAVDQTEIFGDKEIYTPTYKNKNRQAILKFDRMTLEEYFSSKKDVVEKWVLELLSILYVGEFGLEPEFQSALNFLTFISTDTSHLKLLGESDECKRVMGGNSTLTHKLAELTQEKVPHHLGHVLRRIRDLGGKFELTFKKGNSTVHVFARRIICTIPFSILKDVEGINILDFLPETLPAIHKMGYGTNSKLMMGFRKRVWNEPSSGSPLNGSIITTHRQEFWDTSRGQKGKSGILTNFLGGDAGLRLDVNLVEKNLNFLDSVFSGMKEQYDSRRMMMHWPSYPWTKGSYVCFKPGQYTSFHGLAAEPHLGGRFYFAGEHTSIEYSGYMNGAVESGNRAARALIGAKEKVREMAI